jgi:hypothetical protein
MQIHWQRLHVGEPKHDFVHATLYRAAVPGGWLITILYSAHNVGGPTMCFYPDADHTWDGGSLPGFTMPH